MPLPTYPAMTPDDARIDEINDLTEERDRLKDQNDRLIKARQDDAAQISDLCAQLDAERAHGIGLRDQLDTMRADLAREVSARMTANAERDAMTRQIMDAGAQWVEINQPFAALCERVIDTRGLVGFEVEIAGERYIIGDVNPGGLREGGQAFRRDAVVTRARVRVRK